LFEFFFKVAKDFSIYSKAAEAKVSARSKGLFTRPISQSDFEGRCDLDRNNQGILKGEVSLYS